MFPVAMASTQIIHYGETEGSSCQSSDVIYSVSRQAAGKKMKSFNQGSQKSYIYSFSDFIFHPRNQWSGPAQLTIQKLHTSLEKSIFSSLFTATSENARF